MIEAERFLQNHQRENEPLKPENVPSTKQENKVSEIKAPAENAVHAETATDGNKVNSQKFEVQQKHIIMLIIGVVLSIISRTFGLNHLGGYTAGYYVVTFASVIIGYSVTLSVIALIIAAIRGNVRKYMFAALAWLYLFAGLFDIITKAIILG